MTTIIPLERRAGRPMDESKRAAILEAAQKLFMSHGFARTSMDAIADAAGVSKLTAYKHFGSKQDLFAQAVASKCQSVLGTFDVDHLPNHGLRECLIGFARTFLSLILDPDAMAVHHLVLAERDRAPELGRLFFENAVRPVGDKLATIIARHEEAGEISTGDDPLAAAQDLLALLRGRPYMMTELNGGPIDEADLRAHVDHAVDLCLKAWTPR